MLKRHFLVNFIFLEELYYIRLLDDLPHYPFGMLTPGRNWSAGSEYRFGFGGQEQVDEVYGNGNSYTAEFWQYDPRLGRRWNVDPIFKSYESPYATLGNNPIFLIDPLGADTLKAPTGEKFNAGEGYKSTSDGNILFGEGLQSKKFDINYDGPIQLEGGGGYVDYDGELPEEATLLMGSVYKENRSFTQNPNGGSLISNTNIMLGIAQNLYFNKQFDTWMGKDFKIRSQEWGGNGATGGKYKFAKTTSDYLKWGGRALAVTNAVQIELERESGHISNYTATMEQASNVIGTAAPGIYGLSWSIGWEAGRGIAQTEGWLDFKYQLQKNVFGWDVQRSEMCTACPK